MRANRFDGRLNRLAGYFDAIESKWNNNPLSLLSDAELAARIAKLESKIRASDDDAAKAALDRSDRAAATAFHDAAACGIDDEGAAILALAAGVRSLRNDGGDDGRE